MVASMTQMSSRDALLDCALDLLIRHGYRGASFGDIATALGMTRANIHYHFGSKQALVEEVLARYVDETLAALRGIWLANGQTFEERVEQMLQFSLSRFRRYNRRGSKAHSWSLISRLRQDAELLSLAGRTQLQRFSRELEAILTNALSADVARGTFSADTPIAAIAAQLALIADNASAIIIDPAGAHHLEAVYRGFADMVKRGFGHPAPRRRTR